MGLKKVIVTTTIHPPTEATVAFAAMSDWHLIVVGDQNTPHELYDHDPRWEYLSPAWQLKFDLDLSHAIGWESIQRRNFGFIRAHQLGADVVASVDDDNVPLSSWGSSANLLGQRVSVRKYLSLPGRVAFDPVNAGAYYVGKHWHRGFPVQRLDDRMAWVVPSSWRYDYVIPEVVADLWEGNADVDAMCRIVHGDSVRWMPSESSAWPFTSDLPAPFNSQNVFLSGGVLDRYFLFPHVGRMDDIWAAYHLQTFGVRPVFSYPSVHQHRHPHDVVADLEEELLGYRHNERICEALVRGEPDAVLAFLPARSRHAYDLYRRHFT